MSFEHGALEVTFVWDHPLFGYLSSCQRLQFYRRLGVSASIEISWLRYHVKTRARRGSSFYSRAAAFSHCGNVFFPLRQLFGLQSWTFSAAGFFPPRPVFFLPRTGFFPPRTVFSRCLQNAFFLLQRCFCAAARCFFCCFEFFPLQSGIFCWRFFPLRKQLFPAARRFFPAAKRVFFRSDVFFLLRTCVFPALREDKELENVESYTGRSPLVSWIAHGQVGEEGDQTLKQPSANEKLKRAAVDAATCFNGSGYKRERQKEEKAEER